MKKLLSLVFVLVLVTSLCASAVAAPFYLESAGVTIDVPEGMTGADQSDGENSVLGITVNDNPNLVYVYVVRYIEELEGKNLTDLNEEEQQQLGAGIAAVLENPVFEGAEVNGYPVLVIANGDGTQLHYMTLLNGWLLDIAAAKRDGNALENSDIEGAARLLVSVQFDGDAEEAEADAEADE